MIEVSISPKVSVKFPFEPYECQRVFMRNVVDVLDRKLDAALESPTGTGKTLSLLCSTLAWVQKQKEIQPMDFATWQTSGAGGGEKNDEKTTRNTFIPTIFYASRTHSQLEQVVHELNRTEYKWVKTTILGSREHFCINPKVSKIKESNRQAHVCRGLVSKRSCHFYNKFDACTTDKIGEFLDKGQAMDIEDFVKLGTQNSLCPYFLSRQRAESAELILLPYNYIIDPKMRRRYKLDLKNSIVIFDEAHNLESICESNASAELTSTAIAMCIEELKKVLALLVDDEETARAEADAETDFGRKPDAVKQLAENLRTEHLMAVLEKMFSLEEHFDGLLTSPLLVTVPPLDGKASDGRVLLETLSRAGLDANSVERMVDVLRDAVAYLMTKNEEVALTEKGDGMEKVADFLISIFSTHAQEVAAVVGEESLQLSDRVDPANIARNCKLYVRKEPTNGRLHIKYFCFQASISMRMLKMRGVRNVLLASGTLSPIEAFTHNMGLNFGAILENEHALKCVPVLTSVVTRGKVGALVGSFQNRTNAGYLADVADTLIRIMQNTPQGILVFFSSYSQMDELIANWKSAKPSDKTDTYWSQMEKHKRIVVEPRAKEDLSAVRLRYTQGVGEQHGAALFAVCRGKVSEGIDFCDAESRAVVIVGIPYPPIHDERVVLKKMYLDDVMGRKEAGSECQSSRDWYQMEAFRAVNQAIGRVLRHKDDFGTVVLIDARYASAKPQMFPKWLRNTIGKGSSDECALKTARFFRERGNLIETSRSDYVKKQAKVCKMFRQKKQPTFVDPKDQISEITIEEMYSGGFEVPIKKELEAPPTTSSSSFFSLPTNEDELQIKKWEQNAEQPVSNKRKLEKVKIEPKEVAKKRKIVVLSRNSLPETYQKALDIPTSEILKDMSDENKKQFAATLKAYKSESIQWPEVFRRLTPIFVPHRPDLFISCSNILRNEDKMKFVKKSMESKIYN